jgi:hypothetical protein
MKNSESKKAVFIVGSARSGTTLLQSMLASHPDVYSFPETHFFRGTIPKFSFLRWLKFYGEKEKEFIRKFLIRVNQIELDVKIPSTTFNTTEWIKGLLYLLDSLSHNSIEKIWVEKTPMHLYFASLIENVRQETKFIHIIRDGKDVVASLFDASKNNPNAFDGKQSIQKCILRWKFDIQIHKKHLGKQNHHFIFYKDLIYKTEDSLKRICDFLELDYLNEMKLFSHKTKELKFPEEVWKPDASNELKESNKFESIFSLDDQALIKSKIDPIDLSCFK